MNKWGITLLEEIKAAWNKERSASVIKWRITLCNIYFEPKFWILPNVTFSKTIQNLKLLILCGTVHVIKIRVIINLNIALFFPLLSFVLSHFTQSFVFILVT